jgi:predicted DNA-binding transcriptional regulator AlpA
MSCPVIDGTDAMQRFKPEFDPDALMTEVEAADFLKMSERTLQDWRSQKRGPPFVKAGRAVRYRRRDLIAWSEKNLSGDSSDAAA